jgi:hypothetical protein
MAIFAGSLNIGGSPVFLVVVILIVVALAILAIVLHSLGARQVSVLANADMATTRQAVEGCFNKLVWNRTNGEGDFNFVPRARKYPPTLSVSLSSADARSTAVDLWPSNYTKLWGFVMVHATLCWRKKNAVARKLTRL